VSKNQATGDRRLPGTDDGGRATVNRRQAAGGRRQAKEQVSSRATRGIAVVPKEDLGSQFPVPGNCVPIAATHPAS